MFRALFIFLFTVTGAFSQRYVASLERPPMVPREFRAAWSACVYNIDWPSRKGVAGETQRAELRVILDRMSALNMNALIFQVRPNADAVYRSRIEPWSHWVSGKQGQSPGYDPLAYCIQQAHARGIEVHAWFNPFRALPNAKMPTARNHVVKTHPSVIRNFKTYQWMDPSSSFVQQRSLKVIMDVLNRYDIDGVHIDDYFYPYPNVDEKGRAKEIFPDGKTPAQRRAAVDRFVKQMYSSVKQTKPWVRVGISPFGIWRPGVPAGTTAGIDAYHHLAADSLKWLRKGWVDYLSPQLYWRIEGPQSFSRLLSWWRGQGSRPVWPGIASARINSKEDPGRSAKEITNQVSLSRSIGKNYAGHVFWSVKSLMKNRGGISRELRANFYREPSLVPPMPWVQAQPPATPTVKAKGAEGAEGRKGLTALSWSAIPGCKKYVVQARYGSTWRVEKILPTTQFTISGQPDAVAVSAVDRYGNTSAPRVLSRP